MARYFFHLCDGSDTLIDHDGREIGDSSMIAGAALREARAIISQDALKGAIMFDQSIEVRDADGACVYLLRFSDAVTISR